MSPLRGPIAAESSPSPSTSSGLPPRPKAAAPATPTVQISAAERAALDALLGPGDGEAKQRVSDEAKARHQSIRALPPSSQHARPMLTEGAFDQAALQPLAGYRIGKTLGVGSFGKVRAALDEQSRRGMSFTAYDNSSDCRPPSAPHSFVP